MSYVIEDPEFPASEEILSMARKEHEYTIEYKNRTGGSHLILSSLTMSIVTLTLPTVSCRYLRPIITQNPSSPCPCILPILSNLLDLFLQSSLSSLFTILITTVSRLLSYIFTVFNVCFYGLGIDWRHYFGPHGPRPPPR